MKNEGQSFFFFISKFLSPLGLELRTSHKSSPIPLPLEPGLKSTKGGAILEINTLKNSQLISDMDGFSYLGCNTWSLLMNQLNFERLKKIYINASHHK